MSAPKSVVDKLNLEKYVNKLILHKPEQVNDFQALEYDSSIKKDTYDLIFSFIFSLEEFTRELQNVIENKLLEDNGYLYFAYPKKNNKVYKEYIDRDSFISALPSDEDGYVLNSNIKFARMVSLNDVFTIVGLKSTPKKSKKSASSKSSQCVDDYIDHIDDIKQYLQKNEELFKKYIELTPGYQKDWARYIYSAKRKETQEKRQLEMETALGEGYKTIELYKQTKR
ncbi:YdeI/OmpD-associated family protein [Neobacillus drentensis]|uniref:YdeI/OmpD-associated family protein n=1 Tax=Neobacillus drentensis TaxID=220684 RepID=UPI001F1F0870|nr:YdeI/OmpD-associated family protein [Neobacillus drentensis]ULT54739.1 YdeI/OmpD-associated family protein [Neobacillus drentensis]